MPVYIAMIRGINVSGQKLIKMADLKKACEEIGLTEVRTYIQSGNIVFDTPQRSAAKVAEAVADCIEKRFGHEVAVIVRTTAEMEKAVRANPYLSRKGVDLKRIYITFLNEAPSKSTLSGLAVPPSGKDEFQIIGKELFGYFPDGYGRTKLNNNLFERKLNTSATTRNWNTVLRLLEMAREK